MRYPLPANTATATFRNDNDRAAIDLDLEALGRDGRGRITAKVAGYWSTDIMTLYISREYGWREDSVPEWKFTMGHSSGGRDEKEVADDLVAEMNFSCAMKQLVEWAQELRGKHAGFLEEAYQRQRAEDKVRRTEEAAAKEAKIAADKPLGENGAKGLVAMLEGKARQQLWAEQIQLVYKRGAETPQQISAKCNGGRVTFYSAGYLISRKALVDELAALSHRSAQEV